MLGGPAGLGRAEGITGGRSGLRQCGTESANRCTTKGTATAAGDLIDLAAMTFLKLLLLTSTMPADMPGAAFVQDTAVGDSAIRIATITVTATRGGETERRELSTAVALVLPRMSDIVSGRVAADLLRGAPGVHVQQTSAGQGSVILRGLTGNQVLMLVNGVPLNNGTYRDGPGQYLATVDPETIERIEIIRGPGSVLYGSDAQGGVVNIITKTHMDDTYRGARVSGVASGANNGFRGRASAVYGGPRFTIAAGGTFANNGDLRPGGGLAPQDPTAFDTRGFDATLRYFPGSNHTITAMAQHFTMNNVPRYDRYVEFRAPNPGPDAEHVFDPQRRQYAMVRHLYEARGSGFVRRFETTASISVQQEGRNRRRLQNGIPSNTRTFTRDDVYTPGVSAVGSGFTNLGDRPLELTWGGDYYHDQLNSRGESQTIQTVNGIEAVIDATPETRTTLGGGGEIPTGRFPDGATADRVGFFALAETPIVPRVRLSVGARWSYFRNDADVGQNFGGMVTNTSSDITGQIGVVTQVAQDWRVVFRLAEGFRAPNLYDLTNVGSVPGGIAVPNPDAVPEHSISSEVSLRYQTTKSAFDITVYRTTIKDFIDRTVGVFMGDTLFNGERVFQGQNIGEARVVGFEAEGTHRVGAIEARVTVQLTHGSQTLASGVEEPMAKIPPLGGTGRVRWTSRDQRFWAHYEIFWADPQDRLGARDLRDSRIPLGGTPGYAVHNVVAGADLHDDISVTLGLENLTDRLYRAHASGVDNPGRHVTVGLTWRGSL